MALEHDIEQIRGSIRAGNYSNEASVSQGIVLRLLNRLGWDIYDTKIVCPEFALGGRRVDFALCHPPGKPIAFVEVKQIGKSDGAERQLFEYAFNSGVPLAILTDGQEWNFFLPAEQGDYSERRVYKLDLIEREAAECVERFERYLLHEAIASGDALRNARDDYRNVSKARQIRSALPEAWRRLVEEEDDLLLEIVADKVESLCGFKPDPDTVATFLKDPASAPASSPHSTAPRAPKPEQASAEPVPAPRPSEIPQPRLPSIGYQLNGVFHPAANAIDVLRQVFNALIERDASFAERFASLPKHGRTRRYLARQREDLYPSRPDLCGEFSLKLLSGWWMGTNHSKTTIAQIIGMACEVAGLRYGADLEVKLAD